MGKLKFLLIALVLAIVFSFYVTPPVSQLTFGEASRFSLLVYRIFGFLFTGVSLIYSFFWLDLTKIFYYCKKMLLFLAAFLLLSIMASHLLVLIVAQFVPHFQIQFTDQIYLSYQELFKLFSPLSFLRHPEIIWLIGCGIIGLALSKVTANKFQVNAGLTLLLSILNQIFRILEALAPIPIFAFLILMFDISSSTFTYEMILYLVTYSLGAYFFIFYAMPLFWGLKVKGSERDFYRLIFYPSLFAFGFGDVATALPILFYLTQELNSPHNEKERGEVAGILIPFAYLMLPLANLLIASIPLLIFYLFGHSANIEDQITYVLTSIFVLFSPHMTGPGAFAFLLDILKLPQDATATFINVISYLRHIHAFVNCFSIGFIVFYTLAEKESARDDALKRFAKSFLCYTLLLILFYACFIFSISYAAKSYKEHKIANIDELQITSPVQIEMATEKARPLGKIRSLQEIIDSKTLRVGFSKNTPPFSYMNLKGEAVGFDVELAAKLAHDLNCKLELFPLDHSKIPEQLSSGEYDIAIGEVTVTTERIKKINFTNPVMTAQKVLVAKDYKRLYFEDPEKVINDTSFKVAFKAGTSLEDDVKKLFPHAIYVPLKTNDELIKPNIADALFTTRQVAYHWVKQHPAFAMISLEKYPYPTTENLAFAISYDAKDLVEFLNQWLLLQQTNKVIKDLEKKWKLPPPLLPGTYDEDQY